MSNPNALTNTNEQPSGAEALAAMPSFGEHLAEQAALRVVAEEATAGEDLEFTFPGKGESLQFTADGYSYTYDGGKQRPASSKLVIRSMARELAEADAKPDLTSLEHAENYTKAHMLHTLYGGSSLRSQITMATRRLAYAAKDALKDQDYNNATVKLADTGAMDILWGSDLMGDVSLRQTEYNNYLNKLDLQNNQ